MENLKESNESRGRQQKAAITHPSWRFSSDVLVMLALKDLVVMLVVKGKLSKAKSNKLKLITLVASCEGRSCLHGYSKIQEHFPCKRLVMLWYENYKS